MGPTGYISIASNFRGIKTEIGPVALYVLAIFALKSSSTAYEVFKFTDKRPASYKNVHKVVKRLYRLNHISKVKGHWMHGAIRYAITEQGFYYTFLNYFRFNYLILYSSPELIFENHFSKKLLTTFVFPYIKLETVKQLENVHFFYDLFNYLHDCCFLVNQALYRMQYVYPGVRKWRLDITSTESELEELENSLLQHRTSSIAYSLIFNYIYSRKVTMLNKAEKTILSMDDNFMKIAGEVYNKYKCSYVNLKKFRNRTI